ncbi:MAG: N-acetylmuramoyl-L-alanine amidase [Ignavibacteriales bacterium]|nr:N-acetylmuramoyl-L-alanine amidase [Ignavibacteriales bacterium]
MKSIKYNTKINFLILIVFSFILLSIQSFAQQVTGLSGWNIFLDPGHSQNENMGIYNYSEAKKNLRVGLNLRQMLLDWTDIDTVYMCRTNDQQIVSLTQRTDLANSLGAAHYHSIHSDASSSPTSNSTLFMWGQLGIGGPEKTPFGGKKMSQIMVGLLTAGMRTTTRGAMGDRDFYQVAGSTPYLHVNRETNMASELSEAGFHTNPIQNQLNMNESWKRLEAKTMFWTILKYHDAVRPFAGTAVGIVKDLESGLAINGAIVSLNGQADTTDTWQSLFYQYSSNPNLLRNGFYYFEDIPAGTHQLQVAASGFDLYTADVTMSDTFFTFKDVNLVSNVPPTIASTVPLQNDSLYPGVESLVINFTRQMNKSSVEANLTISPAVTYTTVWSNTDQTVTLNTTNFVFNSEYQVTIGGSSLGKFGHPFDGDGNGVGGDPYTLTIKTKVADILAPSVADVYPTPGSANVEYRPVINVSFDELLKTSTISSRFKVVRNSTQTNAAGLLKHYVVNGRSVLNFFITTPLVENEAYTIKVQAGIEDIFGNPTTSDYNVEFSTGNSNYFSQSVIDNFDIGIGNWWQPETSGSTVGVNPLTTNIISNTTVLNANTGSLKSMQLDYDWNVSAPNWLIREYFSPSSPTFQPSTLLQVFMFGDGSNNKFRFAVRETSPGNFEVSNWYDVNWIGWKLITWDLSLGQTGNWVGNNVFEPPLSFDSFQMTYVSGNQNTGTIYFDDVRTASFSPTDVEEETGTIAPTEFSLKQNYPNPFNPSTQIKFSLPQTSDVKVLITDLLGREVATLVNDNLAAGNYSVNFNASNLSSGIYFYTLIADNFKQSKKMILMK